MVDVVSTTFDWFVLVILGVGLLFAGVWMMLADWWLPRERAATKWYHRNCDPSVCRLGE